MTVPTLLSAPPKYLAHAESLADGIETKLDWKHTESLSRDNTLTDECNVQEVNPESISSIHLPPGTSQPQGLSVAPGNVGDLSYPRLKSWDSAWTPVLASSKAGE